VNAAPGDPQGQGGPGPEAAPPEHDGPLRPPESLGREILAILFLYCVLTLIPLALGWAFAPS
jgi:hypothetical protein